MRLDGAAVRLGFIALSGFVALSLITFYTPLGILTLFFLPLPYLLLFASLQTSTALLFAILALPLSAALWGWFGLLLTIAAVGVGAAVGSRYRAGSSAFAAFRAGVGTAVLLLLCALFLSTGLLQSNPLLSLEQSMKEAFLASQSYTMQLGLPPLDESVAQELLRQTMRQLPFFLLLGAAACIFLNQLAARWLSRRLGGQEVPSFPPLRTWKLPKAAAYLYFLVWIVLLIPDSPQWPFMGTAFLNLQPLLTILFLLQGLSFLFWYAYVRRKGKLIPILSVVTLVVLPQVGYLVLSIIGIMETLLPLRQQLSK